MKRLAPDVADRDHAVTNVAYIVGNPWPICHYCKRHVYMIEATGEWRHFDPAERAGGSDDR
jgi:hypothetical protein